MSLRNLVESVVRGELLLPRLYAFLSREQQRMAAGFTTKKDVVVADSRMTIRTFRERLHEFNHGSDDYGYFHPSQLGRCLREVWFARFKAPRDKAPSSDQLFRDHMIFETGTYVGVFFQNLCERAGYLRAREVRVVDHAARIIGHADGDIEVDNQKAVLEIKTINTRGFMMLQKPHESHMRQIHAYMKPMRRELTSVVYLDKDRGAAKEFVVPFSKATYQEHVVQRVARFFRHVRQRTAPEKEGNSPHEMPCRFCSFQRVCYGTKEFNNFMKKVEK